MQMTKNIRWGIAGLGVAGLGIGAYFLFFKPKKDANDGFDLSIVPRTSKKGGIKTTPGEAVEEPNWKNPYDMNYISDVKKWLRGKGIQELFPGAASSYAKTLKNAKGKFNDDEAAVQRIFKRLRDKTQVASISKAFWQQYKTDMWQYLNSFLSKKEMETYVHKPVRKLPNYKVS